MFWPLQRQAKAWCPSFLLRAEEEPWHNGLALTLVASAGWTVCICPRCSPAHLPFLPFWLRDQALQPGSKPWAGGAGLSSLQSAHF